MNLGPDLLIHSANVLFLLAYLVRDILWLRSLTVVAACILIPYYYLQPNPLWTPIYWNLVFTALNLYWIVRLLLERRPIKLTEPEMRLCELVFRTMTPREMMRILKLASWENAPQGTCIVDRGASMDRLLIVYSGRVCASVDGNIVAELGPGHFIGSVDYVTDVTAPADIVTLEPTCYVSWPKNGLRALMRKNPELHSALQTTLAIDLTRWLQASWRRLGTGPAV